MKGNDAQKRTKAAADLANMVRHGNLEAKHEAELKATFGSLADDLGKLSPILMPG